MGVLVPVKAFARAKRRLAPALPPADRAALARRMATHVLEVARPLPTAVVCDDDDVASWAHDLGAQVIWCPGTGLNGAVEQGVARLAEQGYASVIVAHGDLPLAGDLAWLAAWPGVTLVPDRRNVGTNVIAVPSRSGFRFAYGTDSFATHVAEVERLHLGLRIVREPALGWDVDLPDDLDLPALA